GLWIDAVALGQGPQALLTTLYRSTDCLCRRGAAMKNLAQSASPHAGENNAPSKLGTKHLSAVSRPLCTRADPTSQSGCAPALFLHFIGVDENRLRHREPQRLQCLQI